jgi:hypothetical protein
MGGRRVRHQRYRGLTFSSPVAVAASTLAAVALFSPLRRRVQQALEPAHISIWISQHD